MKKMRAWVLRRLLSRPSERRGGADTTSRRGALRLVLLGPTVWTLSGCGFVLRGALKFSFGVLRLKGSVASPVTAQLRSALDNAGVRVLTPDAPVQGSSGQPVDTEPSLVMTVLTDRREKSVVGQTAVGQVREMQLRLRFAFRLEAADGRSVRDDTELLIERDISFNETAVQAKEAEEAMLFEDMQNDIVRQILRILSTV